MSNSLSDDRIAENLAKARNHLKIADHMTYVAFPIIKDNRLIIKILNELAEAMLLLIKAILQNEVKHGRATAYDEPSKNLITFLQGVAPMYLAPFEIENTLSILDLRNKHKKAPLEFVKNEKFVIMIGDKYETITIAKIKEFLMTVKKLNMKYKFD
jgi:hypothetical protein